MARHCSVEFAAVIVLDHGLPAGTCRAPITANFRWWSTRAPTRRAPSGMHLDHAEFFDLCWAGSTAVRVDDGLSDVATLTMAVLGDAYQQVTRPARGDGPSAGPPARSPLRSAARAKASLSCAISASSCATRELASRLSKTKPTSVGGGCETMRHLDDVTSADTGRRPIGNLGA